MVGSSQVVPLAPAPAPVEALLSVSQREVGNVPTVEIGNLSPDLNGDGKVEPWEQEVYSAIKLADKDGDGLLSRAELFALIATFGQEAKRPGSRGSGIPIKSLNPDTDGDGKVEAWEQECYQQIKDADEDKSGSISVKELFGVMRRATEMVKEAKKSSGIPIETLNPDSDGDGKVEAWEVDVFERIKAADADASGVISTKELFGVIKGAAESDRMKKLYRKAAMVLAAVVLFLIAALVAVSIVGAIVGGETIKESKVPDCSKGNNPACATGIVSTKTVESYIPSLFSLAAMPTNQMSTLKDIAFFIDMSANPTVARAVEATFKIAGGYKFSDTQAYLVTTNDYTINLDATAQSGTITMNGATYPVLETAPATGRRLETSPNRPIIRTMTAWQMVQHHRERRRLSGNDDSLKPNAKVDAPASQNSGTVGPSGLFASPSPDPGALPSPDPARALAVDGPIDILSESEGIYDSPRQLFGQLSASPSPGPEASPGPEDASGDNYLDDMEKMKDFYQTGNK